MQAPTPPQPMIGVEATNKIPAEHLTDAYKAGLLAFREDERVPIRKVTGEIGTVSARGAAKIVDEGGEIIPHAVVEHARLSREYGGVGSTVVAGLTGAARGATLGLSDPLAVQGAKLVGGEPAAAAMRERLNAYKELSPVASTVGEIAGIALPSLLSGGTGAVAAGLHAAALPVEGVAALGRLGEGAVARLLPDAIEGLGARAGAKFLEKGAGAALEGAIFGGGNELSEDALGNTDVTAEKMLASMGHGAVVGALAGGALGAGGEVASDALGKLSPYLGKQAGVQAWKALDPIKKFTKEAEARFEGGSAGVGRTLLDLDVIPKDVGLAGAAMTPQELLPRVEEKLTTEGQKINDLISKTPAKVKLSDLNAQIEEVIAPLRKKAGFENVVKSVENYRDSLFEKLGGAAEQGEVAAGATKPSLVIPPHLEKARPQIEQLAVAAAKGEKGALETLTGMGVKMAPVAERPVVDVLSKEVPVAALFAQKRALGELVYKEAKALDPGGHVAELRKIYGKLSDTELSAIDDAAKLTSGPGKAELLAARKNYQALSIAKNALDDTSARMQTNRNLGLSEYLTAGMAAASGHLLAAPVAAVAHKIARARGNAFLAATFDRLSAFQTISRRSAAIDGDINKGVKAFIGRAKGEVPKDLGEVGAKEAVRKPPHARSTCAVSETCRPPQAWTTASPSLRSQRTPPRPRTDSPRRPPRHRHGC